MIETKANIILEFIDGLRGDVYVTFEGTWSAWLYDLLEPTRWSGGIICFRPYPRRSRMVEAMHSIHFSKPSDATKRFVRFYAHRESNLASSVLMHPVPARSEHVLDFEFGDQSQIHSLHEGSTRTAETAALIGLQTYRRVEHVIRGHIESFTVFLQPAALNVLFGLPALSITNADHDAHAVLGRSLSQLKERLGNCPSFIERVRVTEEFFVWISTRAPCSDMVEWAANQLLRKRGLVRIDRLAMDTGLSSRTFQRRFKQTVGLCPKIFARILRFESALQTKAEWPQFSWTEIAHQYGYHDQMHMIHDFQDLSAETPSGLLQHLTKILPPDVCARERTRGRLLL